MVRTYLELKKEGWQVVVKSDFWINAYLLNRLDNILAIIKKNWDAVIIIDGKERSGKSILGMLIGWYLSNGTIGIKNFARGIDDAARKIATLPDKSILMLDEGSLIFSSKDSSNTAQRKLIKLLDVVGQKNLVFIICLPCFFDLNKTIAVRRSLFLCHVYPDDKYNRGRFAIWGEKKKKKLYIFGKKNYDSYSFPEADSINDYMNFEPPFYQDYLNKVKKESLDEVIKTAIDKLPVSKWGTLESYQEKVAKNLQEIGKLSLKEISQLMGLGERTITRRLNENKEEIAISVSN